MRIKTIENIIDSVDPYFIIKDLGFSISDNKGKSLIKKVLEYGSDHESSDLILNTDELLNTATENSFYSRIKDNLIRILPFGYLNVTALTRLKANSQDSSDQTAEAVANEFIAGTAIDLLAFYLNNDYEKAFKVFFKYYGVSLKTKLIHEPTYIEKALKSILIKRKNVLNMIVASIFKNNLDNSYTPLCKSWLDRNRITSLQGLGFTMDSMHLFYLLNFIADTAQLQYRPEFIGIDAKDLKAKEGSCFATFINSYLFKESKEWIVIPFFSDYHIVNSLKFINPKNNNVYQVYIDNYRISYAGIYNLNPEMDYTTEKVRLLESLYQSLVLINYSKEMLDDKAFTYLAIDINLNAANNLKSNLHTFKNPIFLNAPNSSLVTIKSLYDALISKDAANIGNNSDLYICNFNDYKEDPTVYTYNAYIDLKYKQLITLSAQTSGTINHELGYMLSIFDINNLSFKNQLINWIKSNGYKDILYKIYAQQKTTIDFKSFTITETVDGYILDPKDAPEDRAILSNFIIKVDQNIIFKDSEEVIHKGRVLMGGDQEYPIAFSKKDLLKKGAVEDIALKAYTRFNVADMIDDTEVSLNLPTLFDGSDGPNYKHIVTVIRHNINKAPCKYGIMNLGWDKANGVYTALSWQASSLKFNFKSQNVFALLSNSNGDTCINKDLKLSYSNNIPVFMNYSKYAKFLNSGVKDILSMIIASIYRTFLGYNTKPLIIQDSVNARNLIKFIFLALGQIAPYNVPSNTRLIKSKKLFNGLNDYPVYVRCKEVKAFLQSYTDYPYVLFAKEEDFIENPEVSLYNVNYGLSESGYKQITKFALDTFDRFFKWMFNINIEEFSLDEQVCKDGHQLIYEGNIIFSYLWWEDVVAECSKEYNPTSALRDLILNMTLKEAYQFISYYPDKSKYVLRRAMMPQHLLAKANIVYQTLSKAKLAFPNEEAGCGKSLYVLIDKGIFEEVLQDVVTKDGYNIDIDKLRIYVKKGTILDYTAFGHVARVVDRDKVKDLM